MKDRPSPENDTLDLDALEDVHRVCLNFEAAWKRDERPRLEEFLGNAAGHERSQLLRELLLLEFDYRRARGESPTVADYESRFPEDRRLVEELLETSRQDPVPKTIGKYRVISRLDAGGQASVYRAVHPTLDKELVIKLSHRRATAVPTGLDRLVAEGKVLAELEHSHIARIYDLDVQEGCPFLVMEYVRGRNLSQHAEVARPAAREAALLVSKVARALHAAHSLGVIHKDVKPGNILVDESGEPRLIDFGLAELRDAWHGEAREPAGVSGTLPYMPPEQARGETERVDQRSDVFALGAVLYRLLVGEAPFLGKSFRDSLERARSCDFDRKALNAPGIPPALARITLKAMEAEPRRRHRSAAEMATALEAYLRRPRVVAWSAGGVLAVLLIVGLVVQLFSNAGDPQSPRGDTRTSPRASSLASVKWAKRKDGKLTVVSAARALPLRTLDALRVSWQVPPGLEPAVFWVDSEGHVVPWECETNSSPGAEAWLRCPSGGELLEKGAGLAGGQVVEQVGGGPGTEVIFVCARAGTRPSLEEVRELVAEFGPWPRLPDDTLVHFDAAGVRDEPLRQGRGPGGRAIASADSALEVAAALREKLRKHFPWFSGFAFPHVE